MSSKKLLYLIESLSPGGAERQLVNLLKGMVRQGEDVYLITWIDNNFYTEEDIPGVHWLKLKRKNFLDFSIVFKMLSYARRNKVDIIHGFLDNGNLYSFFLRVFLPSKRYFLSERNSARKLPFLRNIYKRIIHSFPKMVTICNSKAGEDFVKKISLFSATTTVIRNGFDLERFRKIEELNKKKLREEYGYKPDEFIILMVGRIVKVKRPLQVIEAFLEFRKKYPSVRLILLGLSEHSYRKELEKKIDSDALAKEKIEILPPVKNVEEYYNLADLYIHNSEREGSPNSLVEAMATGLPVLTTDVGDISYYLNKQKFEYWIEEGKAASILSQLEKIIQLDEQDRLSLGEANYIRIHKDLSCDYSNMVQQHSYLYER